MIIESGGEHSLTESTGTTTGTAVMRPGPTLDSLTRWVPRLLLVIAGLHLVVGSVLYWHELAGIAGDGLVNTIGNSQRDAAFWFMVPVSGAWLVLGAGVLGVRAARSVPW